MIKENAFYHLTHSFVLRACILYSIILIIDSNKKKEIVQPFLATFGMNGLIIVKYIQFITYLFNFLRNEFT